MTISSRRPVPRTASPEGRFAVGAPHLALWSMVGLLLLAAAFRFLAIDSAPPGWRDDELIEFNLDRRIADGWRPLFITEAEGHEPLYHYLHAGTILLFGDNIVGYKWLPLAFGLLTSALSYTLARKMFGVRVALLTAALLAVSFWPIMYSRFGVRHIGVLPWMLGAFYLLYPSPSPVRWKRVATLARVVAAGLCLAAALMTYFAGRAIPLVLMAFLVYLAIFNRVALRQVWWRYLLAIGIAALIALPMFIEIARTPGGEKRTEVVGGPLIELRQGNLQPALETTLGTLGMFTFAGDPEWLYNVEHRPVFDWITGLFFYFGVLVSLIRLKRVESGFALTWLLVGIAPAFVSIPAASFSHTIAALPVVYMLAALGVVEASALLGRLMERWRDGGTQSQSDGRRNPFSPSLILAISLSLVVVGLGTWLTLRDYFGAWSNEYIVRFQYHAPTRGVAKWLAQHPEITDVAIGTNPYQLVLDPLALQLDLPHDLPASWFNAERVMAQAPSGPTIFTALQAPSVEVRAVLSATAQLQASLPEFDIYSSTPRLGFSPPSGGSFNRDLLNLLGAAGVPNQVHPGEVLTWRTAWLFNPSSASRRLKMFLHVLSDKGEVMVGDDREDLNFATLSGGASFWQISQLALPGDLPPGRYQVEVGWYDPETGERLKRADGSDRYLLSSLEVAAP
jgi:4-amino-4-deoxy-L-arabinose transferase-like glycosyltransferase